MDNQIGVDKYDQPIYLGDTVITAYGASPVKVKIIRPSTGTAGNYIGRSIKEIQPTHSNNRWEKHALDYIMSQERMKHRCIKIN